MALSLVTASMQIVARIDANHWLPSTKVKRPQKNDDALAPHFPNAIAMRQSPTASVAALNRGEAAAEQCRRNAAKSHRVTAGQVQGAAAAEQ